MSRESSKMSNYATTTGDDFFSYCYLSLKRGYSSVKNWWNSLQNSDERQFERILFTNLLIGITVAFTLAYYNHSLELTEAENASMDWNMQVNQNIIAPIADTNIPSFVMLDIDEGTYQAWDEPLQISRKRLMYLIKAAVEAKASMVIVNLDISQPMPVEGSGLHPDDQALKNYLANYGTNCSSQKDQSACPTIILRQTFSTAKRNAPILRATFLDKVVAEGAPYLQWASTQINPASNDLVVRQQQLWQSAYTAQEQATVVPSIELLAMGIIQEARGRTDCVSEMDNELSPFSPLNNAIPSPTLSSSFLNLCGLTLRSAHTPDHFPRIMYRMAWVIDDKPPELPYLITDDDDVPALMIFPAEPYAQSQPQASLKVMADSIVVIGSSYREAREVYDTPLGDMPSSLILLNALYSLLDKDNAPIEPSPVLDILFTLIFITLLSVLFDFFFSFLGIVGSSLGILFILLPLLLLFSGYGSWFTFALPLILIGIYQGIRIE